MIFKNPGWKIKKIISFLLVASLLLSFFSFFTTACEVKVSSKATSVQSYDMLKSILKKAADDDRNSNSPGILESIFGRATKSMNEASLDGAAVPQAADTVAVSDSSSSQSYSKTNVQVQGVDEGDVVKNDGEYIYRVGISYVDIIKAWPTEEMAHTSRINFESGSFSPIEAYIAENRLVVAGAVTRQPASEQCSWAVRVMVYDTTDKKNPRLLKSADIEGVHLASRLIDSTLYVITNRPVYYYLLEKTGEQDALPSFSVNDGIGYRNIDYKDISYFPEGKANNYMIVASINISDDDKNLNTKAFLGAGIAVYMSTGNLYISVVPETDGNNTGVSTKIAVDQAPAQVRDDGGASQSVPGTSSAAGSVPAGSVPGTSVAESVPGTLIAPDSQSVPGTSGSAGMDSVPGTSDADSVPGTSMIAPAPIRPTMWFGGGSKTVIYRIPIQNGNFGDVATGEVKGEIINQFSMDEYDGNFRIATTDPNWYSGDGGNNLFILGMDMKVKGKIEGVAKGERIYSVRLQGPKGYMVTFKTVDPLFAMDLSDPTAPKITGLLKIPGYSEYLHPYDETHLIGFGKDAVEMPLNGYTSKKEESIAYYLGMKVSFFDVTDMSNPKEVFTELIGDRGTTSELLSNHRALLFSKEKKLLAFPVSLYLVTEEDKNRSYAGSPPYGTFSKQGMWVYSFDLATGFKFKGAISHGDNGSATSAKEFYSPAYRYEDYMTSVSRAVYINDVIYTLSEKYVKANNLTDLAEIKTIGLK